MTLSPCTDALQILGVGRVTVGGEGTSHMAPQTKQNKAKSTSISQAVKNDRNGFWSPVSTAGSVPTHQWVVVAQNIHPESFLQAGESR